ncbi:MAG TPA: T9SS type A sorting domain-containing protein, partial [Puia sp.]|nr:T9SS type A sorting domain-containing protein [Puia sp.]
VADISNLDTATGSFEYLPYSNTTLNVYQTSPDPVANGTSINSPLDTGAIYFLNLQVPVTGNHAIIIDCENGANIFRNNQIAANPYPIGIPNTFEITGNSALSTTQPNLYQQYYYFFYNMNLELNNCAGSRTEVTANPSSPAPVITINNNILTSTPALSYQWYLNGVPLPGETQRTDSAILSGNYTVAATDSLGCTQISNPVKYGGGTGAGAIQLKVSPNPTPDGRFRLQFVTTTPNDVYLTLTNSLGQRLYESSYMGFSGIFDKQIDVSYLSGDVYFLKVFVGGSSYLQKIVIR